MVDDGEQHFEILFCIDTVRNIGRHDDDIACFCNQRISADGDFRFAFQNLNDGVTWRLVGADSFTGGKREQSDGYFRALYKGATDDLSGFDSDKTGQGYRF